MKGQSDGTQPGDGERTLGSLGKSKAGDFAAAKNVAGAACFASTNNARSRYIRSEEKRLSEFAQQNDLLLDSAKKLLTFFLRRGDIFLPRHLSGAEKEVG